MPASASGDLDEHLDGALVISGVEPDQGPAQLLGFAVSIEAPGAEREAVQAAQEGSVIDPPPAQDAGEVLRKRALGDRHAGRVVRLRGGRIVECEHPQMGVGVQTPRIPLRQALEQRQRAGALSAVAQFDRLKDRVDRVGVLSTGKICSNSYWGRGP